MATNLSQWERERFNYGEAAGDGKGDFLHTHGVKAEHADTLLFSWLSGGVSEVRLPDALPISRGGTGATSVDSAIRNLGYFQDTNYCLRRGIKVLTINDVAFIDRFRNLPDATHARTALGEYTLKGVKAGDTWKVVVPFDSNGLPKIIAEVTAVLDTVVVKTFLPDGTAKGVPMNIPAGMTIDVECK